MRPVTYHRDSEKPVPAKWGTCARCGRRALILTVNVYGTFCGTCADEIYHKWQENKPIARDVISEDDNGFELRGD